jgi:hypothetical protein
VPEVVEHGANGFVCDSMEEMTEVIRSLGEIDRRNCRRIMEERFSDRVLVDAFEGIYRKVM